MTADDLRAIAARAADYDGFGRDDDSCWRDRAALLSLVRKVASKAWSGPGMDRHGEMRTAGFGFVRPRYRSDDAFHDECIFCEAEPDAGEDHADDCPAPALAGLIAQGAKP